MSGWQGAQELHAEGGHAVAYKGMIDCFVRTVREEGTKALFKVDIPEMLHMGALICHGYFARLLVIVYVLLGQLRFQAMLMYLTCMLCSYLQGLLPNYIKVVPSIAIAFVTYEKLKEGLGVELRISS